MESISKFKELSITDLDKLQDLLIQTYSTGQEKLLDVFLLGYLFHSNEGNLDNFAREYISQVCELN